MSSPDFRFRQFTVRHDLCAHKVGTDGVLLGAWAEVSGSRSILDVGAGSGLVALMAAQREPRARVVGVEVDEASARQARENATHSPFADRVSIVQSDVRDFHAETLFDCILCNPPFFTEDTLPPDAERARARNASMLRFEELVAVVVQLLSPSGRFHVILPCSSEIYFVNQCFMNGMKLIRRCRVSTVGHKPPRRSLLSFAFHGTLTTETEQLVLQDPDGSRTEAYSIMTKDFYL